MLDVLGEVGLSVTQFSALIAISVAVLLIAYRPFILSLFDPLNFFLVSTCASLVLILGMNWDLTTKVIFLIFIALFWVGFAVVGRRRIRYPTIKFTQSSLVELQLVLLLLFATIVLANLYLGLTAGFPLLSADPSISKVTSFTGGLGVVKRLNMGPFFFLISGCTVLIALGHKRRFALTLSCISSAFVALSGAKGALLIVLFVQAFAISHKGMRGDGSSSRFIKRLTLPSFGAACAIALAVMVRDNGNMGAALAFFAKRLLFFGDTVLFYFPRRGTIPEFAHVGLTDYIVYLLDPTLGMFRIKEYGAPLGTIITGYLDSGFGPNAQYFVRADIFFGPVLGCVYCFLIGALTAWARRSFFTLATSNAISLSFALMLAASAFDIAAESQMFFTNVIDTAFLLGPFWMIAIIIRIASTPIEQPASVLS